ncbi:FAD-dependent oxidoreductase [Altererythrobacter lutimaris]|uniref:FAD-dependent oxidoreductase n=1 Tax=Altererythrobacter lutimaris TaxID=2743979 RepID=A0A850HAF4_9SPHN|nr:FAD-dependent oxidoreductase [Altererythrobacter lutimaris]NVE94470.1 FAD-dependent oxidoreductase [Altererythrobacter lutimaris]
MSRQLSSFDYCIPVVVVGGGACGATAALAAKAGGAEVLLIEQDPHPYGTTSMSQGLIAAAGTKAQAAADIEDSPDVLFDDIMTKTKGETDPVIARALADNSGPTIDWLTEHCDIPFALDLGFKPSYGNSRYRVHGWPGHGGEDLLGLMHRRLDDHGVDVMLGCRLSNIFTDERGAVSGIAITQPDGSREEFGCEALVLACGGFAANAELVVKHMPELANARYNGHEGSHGDAIVLGQKLGAAVGDMGSYQGYAMLTDPQGITVPPLPLIEGGVLINTNGERFVDESLDIAGMMLEVLAQPRGYVWVVYDETIEATCLYTTEMAELIRLNAPRTANSVKALAKAIGVPHKALDREFQIIDRAKETGNRDAMGRDWSECHVPEKGLRALKVTGALYHTQGGLQIDGHARVLREDGSVIPGLFAGGGSARAVSGPSHWGYMPAMGLCTAVTLGRLAGMGAAERASKQAISA